MENTATTNETRLDLEPVDETVGSVVATVVEMLVQASDVLSTHAPQWSAVLGAVATMLDEELPA